MKLSPAQAQIATDLHRFRVLCCGRRFGKTTLAIDQIKARSALPNSRIAYIAPTFQQARDIAWNELKRDYQGVKESINESRLEIKLVNGSLIILRGWEAIDTLRGQLFDLIVIDEVAMMRNFWLQWQEVVRPTLTDRKGEAIFISTPKGFNHFYELYNKESGLGWEGGPDSDFKSFHFSTYDNPHIPTEEIDKAKIELTEDRFAQEYLADFRKTEGLVYKEFDRKLHTYKELPVARWVKTMVGVDFGTASKAAVYTIKKDSENRYFIEGEFYETGRTDAQVAEYVAAIRPNECYPDPESASGVMELRNRNVNVRDVIKNKDSIRNGINAVRELFKSNRLFVNAVTCPNLIWELETYSYPDRKPFHNEDENPIKENDHACDAIRYALSMESRFSADRIAHQYIPSSIAHKTGTPTWRLNNSGPSQMEQRKEAAPQHRPQLRRSRF